MKQLLENRTKLIEQIEAIKEVAKTEMRTFSTRFKGTDFCVFKRF